MFSKNFSALILSMAVTFVVFHSIISSKLTRNDFNRKKDEYRQSLIEVNVLGDVSSPGIYLYHPGVTVKEVLVRAGLKVKVNKKQVNVNQKIFINSAIRVDGTYVQIDAVEVSGVDQ